MIAPPGRAAIIDWNQAPGQASQNDLVRLRPGECVRLGRRDAARGAAPLERAIAERGIAGALATEQTYSYGFRDPRTGAAYCVRDWFGVEPLYYCEVPGRFFAFANEVDPLLALPGVAPRLNRLKAAIYLLDIGCDALDASMTFFEGIHRLPPGCYLVATAQGVRVTRYASFAGLPELDGKRDQTLAEDFHERLAHATQARQTGAGLLLSGGLKSAAIASLACETLPRGATLPCWSFVPTDAPGWIWPDDPRPALRELSAATAVDLRPVTWNGWGLDDSDDCYPDIRQQPIWFHIREDEMTAMAEAQALGLDGLMNGVGGQFLPLFARPVGVAAAALKRGRFGDVLRDDDGGIRGVRELARLARDDLLTPLLPRSLRHRSLPRIRVESRPSGPLVRDHILKETGAPDWIRERVWEVSRDFRENAYLELRRGALQQRLESWDIIGRRHGLDLRYPYLDHSVAQFCLGLPPSYFLRLDPQRVLRQAMAGRLPDAIRMRTYRRASIADWPWRKLRKHPRERERLRELERNPLLSDWLDLSQIHQALDAFPDEAELRSSVARDGLRRAAKLTSPGGVPTTVEYFRGFARFLHRNGFS